MKVLIVNYYFPPLIDAHAYRWAQIAQYWARNGHQVEVLTGRIRGVPSCHAEFGVDVTRVGLIARSIQELSKVDEETSRLRRLRNMFMNFLRPLYRKLYWPDAAWHWIPTLLIEMWRRRTVQYDLVVSYYPCMGAHFAVAALRGISKYPRFGWIADYGDPFSTSDTMQPNNYAIYDRLNKLTERSLARRVNAMVFTNNATGDVYKTTLRLDNKVRVVPHLVNIDQFYSSKPHLKKDTNSPVVLYYIGGFHRNIREPDRLFDLLRRMNETGDREYHLKIFGPLNGLHLSELSPAECPEIMYLGPIAREEAIKLLQKADAIVNVDNENCIMTPSKIVECIATGRPIINITNKGAYYPPLQVYEKHGYAISLADEKISDDCVIAVKEFLKRKSHAKNASLQVVDEALHKHILETVANQYVELGML